MNAASLHLAPLIPGLWLLAPLAMAAGLALWSFRRRSRTPLLRILAAVCFVLILMNPVLVQELRTPASDIALIVVDRSPSQSFGGRLARTQKAALYLQEELKGHPGLEIRTIESSSTPATTETRLFEGLENALADVPPDRRAGIIIITDGQVHDAPDNPESFRDLGPVHTLLTGDKNEKDRRIVLLDYPAYGIPGREITIRYEIRDTEGLGETESRITLSGSGLSTENLKVPVNTPQTLTLPVERTGQNIFELRAESMAEEITELNNRAVFSVNGVRDRLKVLLVSGRPHAGGRMWRDLLRADPGVDLVHFTILRDPEKLDSTPQDEMALIVFPFQELFEDKLNDFDLIIFDRYNVNRILPDFYFSNIARYVEEGGAFLDAGSGGGSGEDSLYATPLGDILPGAPLGKELSGPYLPALTEKGRHHPVTQTLGDFPTWGPWLNQAALNAGRGDVLMNGGQGYPLLLLDRVGKGRVAQIASDQLWLWARGYEGGGPYAELLRRVAHWLMKEPELDEKALNITLEGDSIIIRKHADENRDIAMTAPDGERSVLPPEEGADGFLEARVETPQPGIYAFESGDQRALTVVGTPDPPELRAVTATPDILAPLNKASGGGMLRLSDTPAPQIKMRKSGPYAGGNWIALRANGAYTVNGSASHSLFPPWASLFILCGVLICAWRHEGRK
ncbi:MAG: hypothetical protein K9G62_05305 [Alphaproteobacteria bacterium]|nr:hypothetical protein [Alphaproteobacteria bacterium]